METKRIVDINTYWAEIIRDTAQFGQIAVAENPEFNRLADCIFRALEDSFIHSATEYGVKRWESMLQIAPSAGETLEERKARILTYLNLKLPYTWRVLKQLIEGIVGEDNVSMELDNDTQTLRLGLSTIGWEKVDTVNDLLSRVLPMNLVVEYDPVPLDYTEIEYLQSSGTQYLMIDEPFETPSSGVWLRMSAVSYANYRYMWSVGHGRKGDAGTSWCAFIIGTNGSGIAVGRYAWESIEVSPPLGTVVEISTNWLASKLKRINVNGEETTSKVNGLHADVWGQAWKTEYKRQALFAAYSEHKTSGNKIHHFATSQRLHEAKFSQGSEITKHLRPCLDNNGVPCMFDKISRTTYYNAGTGTFGYALKESTIPASGVYARLINGELDVIADTEDPTSAVMSTDLDDEVTPFVHFNDVVEAMEYYNIKEEGIEQ